MADDSHSAADVIHTTADVSQTTANVSHTTANVSQTQGEHSVYGKDGKTSWPQKHDYEEKLKDEHEVIAHAAKDTTLHFKHTKELPLMVYFTSFGLTHTVTLSRESDSVCVVIPLDDSSKGSHLMQGVRNIEWHYDWAVPTQTSAANSKPNSHEDRVILQRFGDISVPMRSCFDGRYKELFVDLKTESHEATHVDVKSTIAICTFTYAAKSTMHNHGIVIHVAPYEIRQNDPCEKTWSEIPQKIKAAKDERQNNKVFPMDIIAAGSIARRDAVLSFMPPLRTIEKYPDEYLESLIKLVELGQQWVAFQMVSDGTGADDRYHQMGIVSAQMKKLAIIEHDVDNDHLAEQMQDIALSSGAAELGEKFAMDDREKYAEDYRHACQPHPLEIETNLWERTKAVFLSSARYAIAFKEGSGSEEAFKAYASDVASLGWQRDPPKLK